MIYKKVYQTIFIDFSTRGTLKEKTDVIKIMSYHNWENFSLRNVIIKYHKFSVVGSPRSHLVQCCFKQDYLPPWTGLFRAASYQSPGSFFQLVTLMVKNFFLMSN